MYIINIFEFVSITCQILNVLVFFSLLKISFNKKYVFLIVSDKELICFENFEFVLTSVLQIYKL